MISPTDYKQVPNYGSVGSSPTNKETSRPTTLSSTTGSVVLSAIAACFSYLGFHITFAWMTLFALPRSFLPDFLSFVPTLDSAGTSPFGTALAVDFALISAFGVFHSLFARPSVKKYMGLPECYERTFFVLQTCICLGLVFAFWQNFDAPMIFDVTNVAWLSMIIVSVYFFGVLFLVSSTFALDHFHLFGLSQGFRVDINSAIGLGPVKTIPKDSSSSEEASHGMLATRWHYQLVAHPIMTGMLTMIWATPIMTMPRFLYSASMTIYIIVAVRHFEEPDLVSELGAAYTKYLETVPRFIPFTKLK